MKKPDFPSSLPFCLCLFAANSLDAADEGDLDLDLRSGHTAYRRASLINLCLHGKFHRNRKTFCGRTYTHTYMYAQTNIWDQLY